MLKNCEDENDVQYYENTYNCTFCDYITNKKSNYDRHLLSSKHKNNSNGLTIKQYNCEQCDKIFITRSALWKHNNKYHKDESKSDIAKLTNVVHKLADTVGLLAKNVGNNNNNTTTTNNHNRFNINVYLNKTCKNAMNINEFVDSIQVGIEDLEETSRLGFVDGISRIIINNLNKLDRPDRPIHCSDSKRMTFYIKNEDTWNKNNNNNNNNNDNNNDNNKLKNMVQIVAGKNMKQIYEWQKLNPDYCDPLSKCSDTYQKMLFQIMNGDTIEESNENINKIIKNIAKETTIMKSNLENFYIK
jgi:hypothetical protein